MNIQAAFFVHYVYEKEKHTPYFTLLDVWHCPHLLYLTKINIRCIK